MATFENLTRIAKLLKLVELCIKCAPGHAVFVYQDHKPGKLGKFLHGVDLSNTKMHLDDLEFDLFGKAGLFYNAIPGYDQMQLPMVRALASVEPHPRKGAEYAEVLRDLDALEEQVVSFSAAAGHPTLPPQCGRGIHHCPRNAGDPGTGRMHCNWHQQRPTQTIKKRKKNMSSGLGQFFTQPAVAAFMAGLAVAGAGVELKQDEIRVLDPGCGTGVLASALVQALASLPSIPRISCTLCDVDPLVIPEARRTMAQVQVQARVLCQDFILDPPAGPFDFIICNPPYLKVSAQSAHARTAAARKMEGSTNLYSLFMSQAARLLHPTRGCLVFLVPRSFASGKYFERFRHEFFGRVRLDHVHLFHSRTDAFKGDSVLQENLILCCRAPAAPGGGGGGGGGQVRLTFSQGVQDLGLADGPASAVDRQVVLGRGVLRLPQDQEDARILQLVDRLPATLEDLGMGVSTGPIVAYRLREFHRQEEEEAEGGGGGGIPFVWMHHVRPMEVRWPLDRLGKPQYLDPSTPTRFLTPHTTRHLVLLRRFSPKEQARRIVAAPLLAGQLGGGAEENICRIGVENHINVISLPVSAPAHLARGLAAYLSSILVDGYIRISSGNTQISATELRNLPLPPLPVLGQIGLDLDDAVDLDRVDALVTHHLDST